MRSKLLGSILLILGTSVGAGMLALPLVASQDSVPVILLMMFTSWLVMLLGAYALLEVNLWFQSGNNMVSMAKSTLGPLGGLTTWAVYFLLLYSLLCAYIAGSSDILQSLLASAGLDLPRWLTTVLAVFVLGAIVCKGISSVDIVNRVFISIKLLAYAILIIALIPHIHFANLTQGAYHFSGSTLMVMITSFGYAVILPSLRSYLNSDVRLLKKAVLIGSILPLVIYLIWIFVLQGDLSRYDLLAMLHSGNQNSELMTSIAQVTHYAPLSILVKVFISICAITSFLGVALCLSDFVADGLKLKKAGFHGIAVYTITFLPPLLIVLFAPGIFVKALSYAGIFCVVLLILLPALMLLSGRVRLLSTMNILPKGKWLPVLMVLVSAVLICITFWRG